jgi:TfoX/Sxy family transcriptional regulator of competence genes
MPKPSDEAKEAFRALLPEAPGVITKPMFGNLAAFVNGNMFAGLFGDDLFVRVGEEDQATVRKGGGRAFEPMAGRPMTGYVVLPDGWREDSAGAGRWIGVALTSTSAMPAKAPKPRKKA